MTAQASPSASRITSPPGGDVGCFVFDSSHPGVALAGSSAGLIYRTTNGGSTWTRIKVGSVTQEFRVISQSPASPDTFYAFGTGFSTAATGPGGTGRVYVSQDDGMTWAPLVHQPPVIDSSRGLGRGMAIDRTGQIIVLSDRLGGIFRSADAGRNWAVVQPHATRPYGLAADPAHPDTLYVAASHTSEAHVQRAAILKSTDFGATWALTTPPALTVASDASALAIAVQPGTGTLFATYEGLDQATYTEKYGVARSLDGGATWTRDNTGLPATFNSGSASAGIVFDPLTPSTIYLTANQAGLPDGTGFFMSTDNGDRWMPAGHALPSGAAFVAAARPAAPGYPAAVFAGFPGIAITTDSGRTWTAATTGFNNAQILTMTDRGQAGGYYAGTANGVFRTLNSGLSWVAAAPLPGSAYVNALATDFSRPAMPLYVATPAGLFRSTNAGHSWKSVQPGLAAGLYVTSVFTDAAGDIFATDSGHTLFRSATEGLDWRAIPIGGASDTFFSTAPVAAANAPKGSVYAGLLYAVLSSGLYVSHDGGAHWTLNPAQLQNNTSGYTPVVLNVAVQHTSPYTLFINGSDDNAYSYTPGQSAIVSLPAASTGLQRVPTFLTSPTGDFAFNVGETSLVTASTDGFSTASNIAAAFSAYYSGGNVLASATSTSLFLSDSDGSTFVIPYSASGN